MEKAIHRRSRCAVFRAHMRRAKRYILAREGPCWARHRTTTACPEIDRGGRLLPSLPTSRVVDFSRRLAVYVWSLHQAQPPIQTFPTRA